MKKITIFSLALLMLAGIVAMSGCKAKEGIFRFEPSYFMRADRDLTKNLSSFLASVAIYADNSVEGEIIDWSFEIYTSENDLILTINLDNYNSHWFPVVLDPFKRDIIPLESNGMINLFANIHDTITTVPRDMFNGEVPDNVLMTCTLRDEKGNEQTIEAQMIIQFYQKKE